MSFLLTASRAATQFQAMEVRNKSFACYIDAFTSTTYIMAIMTDTSIRTSTIQFSLSFSQACAYG